MNIYSVEEIRKIKIILKSTNTEVVINFDRPFVIIGEKINTTGERS